MRPQQTACSEWLSPARPQGLPSIELERGRKKDRVRERESECSVQYRWLLWAENMCKQRSQRVADASSLSGKLNWHSDLTNDWKSNQTNVVCKNSWQCRIKLVALSYPALTAHTHKHWYYTNQWQPRIKINCVVLNVYINNLDLTYLKSTKEKHKRTKVKKHCTKNLWTWYFSSMLHDCTHYWRRGAVGQHIIRVPALLHLILLLVQQGQSSSNVTGHQVCVLQGNSETLRPWQTKGCASFIAFTTCYFCTSGRQEESGLSHWYNQIQSIPVVQYFFLGNVYKSSLYFEKTGCIMTGQLY